MYVPSHQTYLISNAGDKSELSTLDAQSNYFPSHFLSKCTGKHYLFYFLLDIPFNWV